MKELNIEEMTSLRGGVLDFSRSLNDSNIAAIVAAGNTATAVSVNARQTRTMHLGAAVSLVKTTSRRQRWLTPETNRCLSLRGINS